MGEKIVFLLPSISFVFVDSSLHCLIWSHRASLVSLLDRIRHGESNIQSLDIGNHHLSDYDPIWLVRAITNCMYVNLHQCRMMESHFITLMNKIINYEINLKHFLICQNMITIVGETRCWCTIPFNGVNVK